MSPEPVRYRWESSTVQKPDATRFKCFNLVQTRITIMDIPTLVYSTYYSTVIITKVKLPQYHPIYVNYKQTLRDYYIDLSVSSSVSKWYDIIKIVRTSFEGRHISIESQVRSIKLKHEFVIILRVAWLVIKEL